MANVRIGAYGVINDGLGAILLVQLGEREPDHGKWTLPGGGLEFGEQPQDAANREIQEETGLTVYLEDPIKIFTFVTGEASDATHHTAILYRTKDHRGSIKAANDGFTGAVQWFSYQELISLDLTPVAQAGVDWLFRSTTYR